MKVKDFYPLNGQCPFCNQNLEHTGTSDCPNRCFHYSQNNWVEFYLDFNYVIIVKFIKNKIFDFIVWNRVSHITVAELPIILIENSLDVVDLHKKINKLMPTIKVMQ